MKHYPIAWVAGLFEGEGTIGKPYRIDTRRPGKPTPNNCIKLGMTDLDVVQRLQNQFGGHIYHHTDKRGNRKEMHVWQLWKKEDVKRLLERMLPYFGHRRAYQAQNKLDMIDGC